MKKFLVFILSFLILFATGFYTFTTMNELNPHAQDKGAVVEEKHLTDDPFGIPFPPPDEG